MLPARARKQLHIAFGQVPRVDLLPPSERERRLERSLIKRWSYWVLVVVLVLAAAAGGSYYLLQISRADLDAANARGTELSSQLEQYSDVANTLSQKNALQQFQTQALSTDIAWGSVYQQLTSQLAVGNTITDVAFTPGAAPANASAPSTSTAGLTVTLTAKGTSIDDAAVSVKNLQSASSVIDVQMASVTAASGTTDADTGYQYQLTVVFNQTVYTGNYAASASASSATEGS